VDILRSLLGHPRQVHNASVAAQAGFAADTYLVGSSCPVPANQLQAKAKYRVRFNVVKTAAGVAAPVIIIRFGTAGSVADAALCTLTFALQTAVVDEGMFEIEAVFRTVGAGTAAVLQAVGRLMHRLSVTGLSVDVSGVKLATSAGFNSTLANAVIGVSVNGGASAAWTVSLVSAELMNLT
jgi:hypothetical protein